MRKNLVTIAILMLLSNAGSASSKSDCDKEMREAYYSAKRKYEQLETLGGIATKDLNIRVDVACGSRGPLLVIAVENVSRRYVSFSRMSLPWDLDHPSIEIEAEHEEIRFSRWTSFGGSADIIKLGPGEVISGKYALWSSIEFSSAEAERNAGVIGFKWSVRDFHRGRFEVDTKACPVVDKARRL